MAGFISDEDIAKVREATDLVGYIGETTPMRQKGRDFWCCCPLHGEKTPSFKVDPTTQLWHCFGCGEGGDAFGYVMKTEDLTFPEAVRKLAERAHIDIAEAPGRGPSVSSNKKSRLKAVCEETASFYHLQLMRGKTDGAARARSYLGGRNLGGPVPNAWNLGYAPGSGSLVRHLYSKGFTNQEMLEANVATTGRYGKVRDRFFDRVMFPIRDVAGETIAFGGRIMGQGEPKYLNSQETPVFHKSQVLYGLDKAKAAMASTGVAIVVEGYTDVIACHQAGLTNVVATLGTALTRQHIRLLSRHAKTAIVYLFDGDAAGQRAADRALQFIDSSMTPEGARTPIELRAVTLPDNLDPAEFLEQRGVDELRQVIDGARQLLRYGIDRRLEKHDLGRAEGRSRAMADALNVLAPIKDSLLAQQYAIEIASMTRMPEQQALDALAKLKPPSTRPHDDDLGSAGLGVGGQSAAPAAVPAVDVTQLPESEINRRRCERKLICLAAMNPQLALGHASALAATNWHGRVNGMLAEAVLDALVDDPSATPAAIVTRATQTVPSAGGMLTDTALDPGVTPEDMMAFLEEELAMGDVQDTIDGIKAQLRDSQGVSPQDQDELFQMATLLQKDLEARRARRRSV
ncbi:MAG: DNA primase [Coriobacteriia bacterium]|nr:DNA primase [Coriobacteriia bacterium]